MSEDIFALVHADLDARNEKGRAEYGKTLTAFDGRDTHRDLYEELLDAVMYERKRRLEFEAALLALDSLVALPNRHGMNKMYAEHYAEVIEQALGRVK